MRKLKHSEIDFVKYNACIEQSAQRKYSATPEFLNAVCGSSGWELIVNGDYEAVMPVPLRKKWNVKMVINPVLCQQLGVFSEKDDAALNKQFFNFLTNQYTVAYYAFNDRNTFLTDVNTRKNFIIDSADYQLVKQKYSPKRRRKLRIDPHCEEKVKMEMITFEEGLDFMKKYALGLYNDALANEFFGHLHRLNSLGRLEAEAFFIDEVVANIVLIYLDAKTSVLVGTFNNKDFVKFNGASILIDRAIERHIGNRDFDFEGSEVPGIIEFFTGFRPELRTYPVIQNSRRELLKSWLKL